jgi:hypothetical protein
MEAIAERRARPNAKRFYRPGTDLSFCIISQHFVLGYFHSVPHSFAITVVRIEKAASRLRRTSRDKSSVYNPQLLKLALIGFNPGLPSFRSIRPERALD